VIGYDDWLKELPRAIRGEASPERGAEFASKVLDLYRPDATARRIYDELVDSDSLWTSASVTKF
jgi:hypothetical protein